MIRLLFLLILVLHSCDYKGGEALSGSFKVGKLNAIFYGCGKITQFVVLSDQKPDNVSKTYLETGCRAFREQHNDEIVIESKRESIKIKEDSFFLKDGRVFFVRNQDQDYEIKQVDLPIPISNGLLSEHLKEFFKQPEIVELVLNYYDG